MIEINYAELMALKSTDDLVVSLRYYTLDRGESYLAVSSNILVPITLTISDQPILSPYASKPIELNNVMFTVSGWTLNTGTTLYEYILINNNITVNTFVEIIPSITSTDIVVASEIYAETNSGSGFVTIYAKNKPTNTIIVSVNIFYL